MSWTYKHYTADISPEGDQTRHLAVMKKITAKGPSKQAITFTGPSQEAVQGKIDKFWLDEADKAGSRAAARVKTAATKAQTT